MDGLRIKGFTRELGKPADWDETTNAECGSLAVIDAVDRDIPVMISEWKPSEAELAALTTGKSVYLWVYGVVHPPVAITVGKIEFEAT